MILLTLRRTGLPVGVWRKPDLTWRSWAYSTACEHNLRDLRGATITFQPLAEHPRNIFHAPNYWATVELVIDGLIGAQLITDRKHIAGIMLHPSRIAGVNGLEVTVSLPDAPPS